MHVPRCQPWEERSLEQARALQVRLARQIPAGGCPKRPRRIAGVDAAYCDHAGQTWVIGAVVVVDACTRATVEARSACQPVRVPYVPGLLSFRELPAILAALRVLESPPEVILCDGHGRAHPRRFGLACHLGYLLDLPSIGCAKSVLVGRHATLPVARGRWRALVDHGETVGAALRTRTGVRPVYVSVGWGLGLRHAISITMRSTGGYRIPEPIRRAHALATEVRGAVQAARAQARFMRRRAR